MIHESRLDAARKGALLLATLAICGCGGSSGSNPVPVASVSVALAANQLLVGQTTTATGTVLSASGTVLTGRSITWSSSSPTVATVSGSGSSATVTAVAAGTTTITASSEGKSGSSGALTVSAPPNAITDLTVAPTAVTLANPGSTQSITTTPVLASGASVVYANTSSNVAVATVTPTGANPMLTAVAAGTATITIMATASGSGLTTNALSRTVSVTVPAVASGLVTLTPAIVSISQTAQATVVLRDANGAALANRQIVWSTNNAAVATVSGSGATITVTAVSAGSAIISATSEGISANASITVQPASACTELTADANTVALYHFNEGAGQTVANSAGATRNGTLGPDLGTNQDPTWIATGKFGSALRFTRGVDDASSDYVDVANANATFPTNQASVEFYVRPLAPYGHSYVFTAGFINFNVNIDFNGGIEFGIGNGTTWHYINAVTPNLNNGSWHHVVATYDGAMMRVYYDGQQRLAVASTTVLANPNDFKIGGRPFNTFLNGDMDEVRLSNVARTAAEVLAHYCP